jgi:ParB family chromosome partitioning protein
MSNKKSGLGRGLSALLESNKTNTPDNNALTTEANHVAGNIGDIAVSAIEANPFQPRDQFDQQALEELSESIKSLGLIQPVTVRKLGYGKYQLISGERRFRASQLAGLKKIPAYIRIANDQQMLEMALVENIQRENLDPIEIAISYQRLIEECKLTQDEMADRVGKQRSTIANYLRLLKLPEQVQIALKKGTINMGQARTIINIENKETQFKVFEEIVKGNLSVREVESLVKDIQHKSGKIKKKKEITPQAFTLQKITNDLTSRFGSRIEIKQQKNGKGRLTFPFNSNADLERIYNLLK